MKSLARDISDKKEIVSEESHQHISITVTFMLRSAEASLERKSKVLWMKTGDGIEWKKSQMTRYHRS